MGGLERLTALNSRSSVLQGGPGLGTLTSPRIEFFDNEYFAIGVGGKLLKEAKIFDILKILSEFPAKAAIIAPTIITDEIALVTDISGV